MAEIPRANRGDPLNLIRIMLAQGMDDVSTSPFLSQHLEPAEKLVV